MRNSLVPELDNDREAQMIYEEEGLVLEITEAICELMQKRNIKRSELARKLGVDKSYITQLLDGSSNMTLKTVSDVLFCLDSRAKIQIEPLINQMEEFVEPSESCENYHYPLLEGLASQKKYKIQDLLAA